MLSKCKGIQLTESIYYKNPLITIGIAVFKRANYLEEALNSALSQTYKNIEIVISQDSCDSGLDSTVYNLCQNLLRRDPRIVYRYNEKNLGLAGNWNAIADAANGLYLAIMGDDDRLTADFVETLLKATNGFPDVIFSNHNVIDSKGNRLDVLSHDMTKTYHRDNLPCGYVSSPEVIAWRGAMPITASLILAKQVQALRFQEELNTPELEFFIRLMQNNGTSFFISNYLCEYRVHQESETSRGLWIHRLTSRLISIKVSAEVEPAKKALIEKLIITAVNQYLLENEIISAKILIQSPYYNWSNRGMHRYFFQIICTNLPFNIGTTVFKYTYLMRNKVRYLVANGN